MTPEILIFVSVALGTMLAIAVVAASNVTFE
jgi:hypothetical protein